MMIGVIGAGRCSPEIASVAEAVGRELAAKRITLICGGLGGVMEAACKGARQAGGRTIGILPGNIPSDANPYVEFPIVTGMGEMRNVIIVKSAQAVIAIDGEYGTLSEIGHALKNNVPVVGINTWVLSKEGEASRAIIPAETAAEAVEKAQHAARHT